MTANENLPDYQVGGITTEKKVNFISSGYNIAGTLALPNTGGPYPVVLLIPGSGQVDRNENHKTTT